MIHKTYILDVDKASERIIHNLIGIATASKGRIEILVRVDERDFMGFTKDERAVLIDDAKKFPNGLKDTLVRMCEDESAAAVGYRITSGKGEFTWNKNTVTVGKGCIVLIVGDEAMQKAGKK